MDVVVAEEEAEVEKEVNPMKENIGTPSNVDIAISMVTKMLIAGANRKVVPSTLQEVWA